MSGTREKRTREPKTYPVRLLSWSDPPRILAGLVRGIDSEAFADERLVSGSDPESSDHKLLREVGYYQASPGFRPSHLEPDPIEELEDGGGWDCPVDLTELRKREAADVQPRGWARKF